MRLYVLVMVGAVSGAFVAAGCAGETVSGDEMGDSSGGDGGTASESGGSEAGTLGNPGGGEAGGTSSLSGGAAGAVGDPGGELLIELDGREFILQSAEGYTPLEGITVRIWFGDGELGFAAGCNSHSGAYTICGTQLCVESMASTLMGCDAARHAQDDFFAEFFTSQPYVTLVGDELTAVVGDVTLVLLDREAADPDRPLTGRTWDVAEFMDGQSVSAYALPAQPTIRFAEDGSMQIFTSCNTGEGTFTTNEQTLVLSNVAYTEQACSDDNTVIVDAHIQAVLANGVVSYSIEAARLTLTRGEMGLAARTE